MAIVVTDEIKSYSDFILSHKYDKVDLKIILRDKKNSIISYDETPVVFPRELNDFTPIGNPPSIMFGYSFEASNRYVSYFFSQSEAIHLKLSTNFDNDNTHPILLWDVVEDGLFKILNHARTDGSKNDLSISKVDTQIDSDMISKISGFDSFIYNVLTGKKLLIVGNYKDAIKIIQATLSILPDDVKNDIAVTINIPFMETTEINIAVIDNDIYRDSNYDTFLNNSYDILDLKTMTAYGEYTSNYTEQIASNIKVGEMIKAKELVSKICDLTDKYQNYDDLDTFVSEEGVRFDDADLIKDINNRRNLNV